MMTTLLWKEYREHRFIWITMIVMTGLLGLAVMQLSMEQNTAATLGMTVLAMAAVYGVVCGSMMFAGERESGTLVFLDVFHGKRDRLWLCKVLIGVFLAITEALAVAFLLHWFRMAPPDWLNTVAGLGRQPGFVQVAPKPALWLVAVALLTLEALAWGLLASSWTKRVLSSAGLALLIGFHVWWLTILFPAPASLVIRMMVLGLVLFGSFASFINETRDAPQGPPEIRENPKVRVLRELQWEIVQERRYGRAALGEGALDLARPVVEVEQPLLHKPEEPPRPRGRRGKARDADSPREVVLWLTLQQAQVPLLCMAGASLVMGMFVPAFGQVVWPLATLLLGVACGTAPFAREQADLSYQFLAAQHFPLKTIWNVKVLFWAGAALLLTVLMGVGALVAIIFRIAANPRGGGAAPLLVDFGMLLEMMGPVLFFGVWLVYGFCVGQMFVYLCKKTIYAVLVSALVAAGAIAVWLPSLLCRGMVGWQIWLPALGAIAAARVLVRAWAGGRIQDHRPMSGLVGVGLAALAWLGVYSAYRAWSIPDAGAPVDRIEFKASLPSGDANLASSKIHAALAEMEAIDGKKERWLGLLAEVRRLPVGMLETVSPDGGTTLLRHLPICRKLSDALRTESQTALAQGKPGQAFDHLAQMLALSRNLRKMAPIASYLVGVEVEENAVDVIHAWLTLAKPGPQQLKQVMDELDRHAAETPPPLDCLQTECYRAGGTLANPATWSFSRDPKVIRERWLVGAITLSLDTPWEKERAERQWQLVWAGLFRALQTPHWQLPKEPAIKNAAPGTIMHEWLPSGAGPDATVTGPSLLRLLEESWLSDDRLYCSVAPLRAAGNRSRWRVDACRVATAVALYQHREGKPPEKLADLVPKDLPEVPTDPYSGRPLLYRISAGENIGLVGGEDFQGMQGPARTLVDPGQAILWSTGPDGVDHGGRKHGGRLTESDPRWSRDGFDLVAVAPARK